MSDHVHVNLRDGTIRKMLELPFPAVKAAQTDTYPQVQFADKPSKKEFLRCTLNMVFFFCSDLIIKETGVLGGEFCEIVYKTRRYS